MSAAFDPTVGAAIVFLRQDPRSDEDLLARFLDQRDEVAFEALVVRHTPSVRAACRCWLRAAADIDDAAQATFLVLVQRAGSIRDRAALGRWLVGVAAHVARRLRQQQKATCPVPEDVPDRVQPPSGDLHDLLTEEVGRLPEKYRLPVQLCYLAGLPTAEAAQRLGWPKGTVLTRLAWARKRLQQRLSARGLAGDVPTLLASAPPTIRELWLQQTARAARAILAGEPSAGWGVTGRTVSLTEGVVRAMLTERLKYIALGALLAVCLAGLGVRQWVLAAQATTTVQRAHGEEADIKGGVARPGAAAREKPGPAAKEGAKAEEAAPAPAPAGRRREAVIRLPVGTFVKEVEAAPYGSGRVTWTYEDERVLGLIEASVMGFEVELATEAEYSLSSNGTIYGLLTGVRLNHVRVPEGGEFGELKPFAGLWPVVEPLVNETLQDLPFSYRFRVQGDRLVISNFRVLLAGPNPLGKLGGLMGGGHEQELAFLGYFQALGTAFEGTYTASDGKEKPAPARKPGFLRPRVGGARSPRSLAPTPPAVPGLVPGAPAGVPGLPGPVGS